VFQEIGVLDAIERGGFVRKYGALWTHHAEDAERRLAFQPIPSLGIDQDWTFFFSPDKTQASGRPLAEAVKYLAYLVWGNHPGAFHLLVVAVHVLASFLWAWACRRLGLNLELSWGTGLLFLVNVTHFQAVHHISALDYPLALCWMLVSLGCYAHACRSGSPWWWVGRLCRGGGAGLDDPPVQRGGGVLLPVLVVARGGRPGAGCVARSSAGPRPQRWPRPWPPTPKQQFWGQERRGSWTDGAAGGEGPIIMASFAPPPCGFTP
jgi:hypothetical protein